MGFFPILPPGSTATAATAPPGPKATAKTQSEYHNQRRAAYDPAAPVLVQMVPEIGEQAAEVELSGRFRGVLAMARGMVTGSLANSSTSGASTWASLLSQSNTSSPAAKRASRAWGRMTEDEDLASLFHDPAAQAAGQPRHDPAASRDRVQGADDHAEPTTGLGWRLILQHRALRDGLLGFPGDDGRLPIPSRCGRVYD